MLTKDLMTRNVETVGKDTSLVQAYKLMCEKNIRHLPVIDPDGIVSGMLSDRDLQRAMVVDRSHGEESEEIYLNKTKKVAEYMTSFVFTAFQDSPLSSIVEKMLDMKISAVVIVDRSQKCIGIVTTDDILRTFMQQMERKHEVFDKPMSFFFSNTLY